ncbi:hypothetical protein FOA52_008749 [Chlamydomonas sp. UWO 241]|nr:hypothetical protein FOA52_008749 [Chlamydomonas sp. UWO 241]
MAARICSMRICVVLAAIVAMASAGSIGRPLVDEAQGLPNGHARSLRQDTPPPTSDTAGSTPPPPDGLRPAFPFANCAATCADSPYSLYPFFFRSTLQPDTQQTTGMMCYLLQIRECLDSAPCCGKLRASLAKVVLHTAAACKGAITDVTLDGVSYMAGTSTFTVQFDVLNDNTSGALTIGNLSLTSSTASNVEICVSTFGPECAALHTLCAALPASPHPPPPPPPPRPASLFPGATPSPAASSASNDEGVGLVQCRYYVSESASNEAACCPACSATWQILSPSKATAAGPRTGGTDCPRLPSSPPLVAERSATVWGVNAGSVERVVPLTLPSGAVLSAAGASVDGGTVLAAGVGTGGIVSAARTTSDGAPAGAFSGATVAGLTAVATVSNGAVAVAVASGLSVSVWRGAVLVATLQVGPSFGTVPALALSPSGNRLAASSSDGSLRVWNVGGGWPMGGRVGDLVAELLLPSSVAVATSVALSSDGTIVVAPTGSWLRVWQVSESGSWRLRFTLSGHTQAIRSVAVSSDGKRAFSGACDGTARAWDLSTGSLLAEFPLGGASSCVEAISCSADGQTVVVAGQADALVRLWGLPASA